MRLVQQSIIASIRPIISSIAFRSRLWLLIFENLLNDCREINRRLDELDLIGPILTKVRGLIYDMAEDIVRRTVFDMIATAYGRVEVSLAIPGCGVELQKLRKKDMEDEFGWLLGGGAGGWLKERKRRRFV
eukprot:SAG31_NODE_1303_length_8898_cov_11.100693_3_plen_131_part_00